MLSKALRKNHKGNFPGFPATKDGSSGSEVYLNLTPEENRNGSFFRFSTEKRRGSKDISNKDPASCKKYYTRGFCNIKQWTRLISRHLSHIQKQHSLCSRYANQLPPSSRPILYEKTESIRRGNRKHKRLIEPVIEYVL